MAREQSPDPAFVIKDIGQCAFYPRPAATFSISYRPGKLGLAVTV